MKEAMIFVCNGSVFELLLNSGFTFETLQAPGKLPNATERLHNMLIGYPKFATHPSRICPNLYQLLQYD